MSQNVRGGLDVRLCNPLNDKSRSEMYRLINLFMTDTGIDEIYKHQVERGAFLAQDEKAFDDESLGLGALGDEDEKALKRDRINTIDVPKNWFEEITKWNLPWQMWSLVTVNALGAVTQGMDQSAVNSAQLFYRYDFGIAEGEGTIESRILGLVNSAPYLCCVGSCLLTSSLNKWLGRRKTISLCCFLSATFAFGQAFSNNWYTMFALRFCLGLGIGPKSTTIPIYASETAPQNVRGGLVMMWQMFTAMGIMLGYIFGVVFQHVGSCQVASAACGLGWRLMIGSPSVVPLIVMVLIMFQPESPRWNIGKGLEHMEADRVADSKRCFQASFDAYLRLRRTTLQAARDMFLTYHYLKDQRKAIKDQAKEHLWYKQGKWELLTDIRNRNAFLASMVCMFGQQLCGVNVIVYYSSIVIQVTQSSQQSVQRPLLFAMGWGVINFLFAIPAFYTIDTLGRRSLLLFTFPFLALFQFLTAIAFIGPDTDRDITVKITNHSYLSIVGMYLFGVVYSFGEGPVPFVYSSESMPLYIRDLGMGYVTSLNWLFDWIVSFTAPLLFERFQYWGAFVWYACWCIILEVLIFIFVRETCRLSLEQLDAAFRITTAEFLWNFAVKKELKWFLRPWTWWKKGMNKPIFSDFVEDHWEEHHRRIELQNLGERESTMRKLEVRNIMPDVG